MEGHMKRIIASIIFLLLSACTAPATPQPTLAPTATTMSTAMTIPTPTLSPLELGAQMAEDYVNGIIDYPTDLTAEQKNAFDQALVEVEPGLSVEQQKRLIEDRFEKGSTAFEAVIKADGNLEYYDGTWKTLEAMRNLNGEIIPWGESYDMVSEEGRNGILTNIMVGNEAMMEKHIQKTIENIKQDAEKKGLDNSNFNILYVQFFPNTDSLNWKRISETVGFYEMQGQIVFKNANDKILVINLITCLGSIIRNTYGKSGNVIAEDPSELYDQKEFDNSFLGITSSDSLNYFYYDLASLVTSNNELAGQAYLEKVLNSNMENFLQKIAIDPTSVSKNFYSIDFIIYPNY
jgi:hypothetical protein